MRALNVLVLLTLFVLSSCTSKETKSTLADDLVGEWRNVYLNVTMPTVGSSDSSMTTVCDSSNWEAMLHIKPIHTFFNKDGTYRSEYYTLNDSLFRKSAGTWHVSNDTLIMNESDGVTYKLRTTIKNNLAEFDGMLDFDADGKADDHYVGRQRKH
ncbi:hypothetical protein [Chryseolinea soli]|uniref:hypothetical protein n=1 Tax=Chryseolinea soli TaxID=2321403 RepID=UPI00135710A9|nr:hypothetical protein [Chryseolinea soli]